MFKRRWPCVTAGTLILLIGLFIIWWDKGAWSIPSYPEQLFLISIDGYDYQKGKEPKATEKYRGVPLLGQVEITDEVVRHQLMSSLKAGVAEHYGSVAKCFWPRHAVRIVSNGRTIEYVICFECEQIMVYEGQRRKMLPTTNSAQKYFNEVLQQHGIPLAPLSH